MNPDVRPACLNQPLLFEAEDLASHQAAKALCDTCPAFGACGQLLKDTINDYGYGPQLGPRGTWAGRLLAPDYKGREAAAQAPAHKPHTCGRCGTGYDLATVTVTARYDDCSVWKCPGCGVTTDDRIGLGAA